MQKRDPQCFYVFVWPREKYLSLSEENASGSRLRCVVCAFVDSYTGSRYGRAVLLGQEQLRLPNKAAESSSSKTRVSTITCGTCTVATFSWKLFGQTNTKYLYLQHIHCTSLLYITFPYLCVSSFWDFEMHEHGFKGSLLEWDDQEP